MGKAMNSRAIHSFLLCIFAICIPGCGTPTKSIWYQPATGDNSSVVTFENESPFLSAVVWQYPDSKSCTSADMQPMPFGGETSPLLPPDKSFVTRLKTGETFTFSLIGHRAFSNVYESTVMCTSMYSFDPERGYNYLIKMAAHGNLCEVRAYKIDTLDESKSLILEPSLRPRESRSSLISGQACYKESTTK